MLLYVIIFVIIFLALRKTKKQSEGCPISPADQKSIDNQMMKFFETMPDAGFFKLHPKYEERYLQQIDLSELDSALGKHKD